ncbi:hypothetical protein P4C99_07355 [Pontiellaceae bacterium B1224]|nr:hypothetical protein [Pontiellaceae bacterium B1224]
MRNKTRILGAAIAAATLAASSADAVAYAETWDNDAADNDFTNALNWSNDTNGPLFTLTSTNDIWTGTVNLEGADYSEFNSPGLEVFVKQLNVGTTTAGEFRFTDGTLNSQKNANGGNSYNRTVIGQNGASGVFMQSGGTYLANKVHVGYTANSSGEYIMSGGTLENGGGEGNHGSSLIIAGNGDNAGMTGLFEISGGAVSNFIRGVELGNDDGSIGTFHVVGTGPDAIIFGDNANYPDTNNAYATWFQYPESVLKVGIDETAAGITPIQVVDLGAEGGRNDVQFEVGALLEPYFTGTPQVGKWVVLEADDFIDYGIAFAPSVTDPDWSFTITNNTLEVWYGLGDSGYVTTNMPPTIEYVSGEITWDGEAGDNDWDNPVNWAFNDNDNNSLPAEGGSQAIIEIKTADPANHPIYTSEYGTRTYSRLHIGRTLDGRLDVIGVQLNQAQGNPMYIGQNAATGTLNVLDGATMSYSANVVLIGNGGTGIVNVENGSTLIFGRGNAGDSVRLGLNAGGDGTINVSGGSTLLTRTGFELGATGNNALLSVQGSGNTIGIGSQGSVDGFWYHRGGTLQMLVDTNGLSTILVDDYGDDGTGGDAYFYAGAELDVDFTGWDGGNGTWDVMQWEGTLVESNLAFAAEVDTNIWSFAFVDTGFTTNGVDTLRVYASGFGPEVQPHITEFSVSGSTVNLSWDSELGIHYNILSKSDLVNAGWSTNTAAIPGAGSTTSTNLTGPGEVEFYQIEAYEE